MATQVDITIRYTQEAVGDDYKLTAVVTTTSGPITPAIFVHKSGTQEFARVAHAGDLDWPTTRDTSIAFYRKESMESVRESIEEVVELRNDMERRVQELVDEYHNDLDSFLGDETITTTPSLKHGQSTHY